MAAFGYLPVQDNPCCGYSTYTMPRAWRSSNICIWAEPGSGFTALFERLVIDWLKEANAPFQKTLAVCLVRISNQRSVILIVLVIIFAILVIRGLFFLALLLLLVVMPNREGVGR